MGGKREAGWNSESDRGCPTESWAQRPARNTLASAITNPLTLFYRNLPSSHQRYPCSRPPVPVFPILSWRDTHFPPEIRDELRGILQSNLPGDSADFPPSPSEQPAGVLHSAAAQLIAKG